MITAMDMVMQATDRDRTMAGPSNAAGLQVGEQKGRDSLPIELPKNGGECQQNCGILGMCWIGPVAQAFPPVQHRLKSLCHRTPNPEYRRRANDGRRKPQSVDAAWRLLLQFEFSRLIIEVAVSNQTIRLLCSLGEIALILFSHLPANFLPALFNF